MHSLIRPYYFILGCVFLITDQSLTRFALSLFIHEFNLPLLVN